MGLPEYEEKRLPSTQGNAEFSWLLALKQGKESIRAENNFNTSLEGAQTGTEGAQQQGRTFTQEDVNRIVQERLAKEKGKGNEDLDKRAAELPVLWTAAEDNVFSLLYFYLYRFSFCILFFFSEKLVH